MFSSPGPNPGLPFELAAALNEDPATAEALEGRLREMEAITPQAVANAWDSAEAFAKEVGIFQGVARRLWRNMEAVCARRVSALADASPPHHAGNPISRGEWTGGELAASECHSPPTKRRIIRVATEPSRHAAEAQRNLQRMKADQRWRRKVFSSAPSILCCFGSSIGHRKS